MRSTEFLVGYDKRRQVDEAIESIIADLSASTTNWVSLCESADQNAINEGIGDVLGNAKEKVLDTIRKGHITANDLKDRVAAKINDKLDAESKSKLAAWAKKAGKPALALAIAGLALASADASAADMMVDQIAQVDPSAILNAGADPLLDKPELLKKFFLDHYTSHHEFSGLSGNVSDEVVRGALENLQIQGMSLDEYFKAAAEFAKQKGLSVESLMHSTLKAVDSKDVMDVVMKAI